MQWLVIGSNSFSGAGFVQHLLGEGQDVLGVSRSEEVALPFRPYGWKNHSGFFRFEQVDLNHDLERLEQIVKTEQPRYIVNFAAQSMVGESWQHPEHWMQTNVLSFVQLLEMLRRNDAFEKYVHVTTPEVYGSVSGWVSEDCSFNPSTPYAVSRAAGDLALSTWHKAYDIPFVSTRAANVYGAGQQLYRIIPRTILFALTGQKLQLHGGGYSERSFIDMRDVSSATQIIAEKGQVGQTYHISTKRRISIRALVEMILEQLGSSFADNVEEVGDRLGKDQSYQLDSTKLRETLDWQDVISLEQGIADVIAWAHDNLDALKASPQNYTHKP